MWLQLLLEIMEFQWLWMASSMVEPAGWRRVQGSTELPFFLLQTRCYTSVINFKLNRIAMYKAIYPTVGTLADVLAAIDQVSF